MSGVEGGDGTVSGAEVESMDGDMTCERCDEHEAIACKLTKMRRTPRCREVGEWVGRTRLLRAQRQPDRRGRRPCPSDRRRGLQNHLRERRE